MPSGLEKGAMHFSKHYEGSPENLMEEVRDRLSRRPHTD